MTSLAHNAIFTSYSAPAKAPVPAAERVVHSTVFSAYGAAESGVIVPAVGRLRERWNAWRAARKLAREERELWALAQTDPRIMTDLICALNRQD